MLYASLTFGDGRSEDGGSKRPIQVTGKSTSWVRTKVNTQSEDEDNSVTSPLSKLPWLDRVIENCCSFPINSERLSEKSQVL